MKRSASTPMTTRKRSKTAAYGRTAIKAGSAAAVGAYGLGTNLLKKFLNVRKRRASTKTKKRGSKDSEGKNDGQHADTRIVKVYINRKKGSKVKNGNKFSYLHTHQEIISGNEGLQAISIGHSMLAIPNFFASSNTRNLDDSIAFNFFEMKPNAKITGSAVVTAGTIPLEQYVNIRKVVASISISSLESVPQECYVLWCMANQNTSDTPLVTWNSMVLAENLSLSAPVAATVTTTTTSTPGAINNPAIYGCYPTTYKGFKKYWNVKAARKIILQPGDTVKFELDYNVNYKASREDLARLQAAGTTYKAGLSLVPMIIARGNPVKVQDGAVEEMTWSKTKIGMLVRETYYLSEALGPPSAPVNYNFFGQVLGNIHSVGESNINDLDTSSLLVQV